MRTLCEATWEEENKDGDLITKTGKYWLLHFGLKHEIFRTEENKLAVGTWTVGICQDFESGRIRCFLPEQLRILGDEIKK